MNPPPIPATTDLVRPSQSLRKIHDDQSKSAAFVKSSSSDSKYAVQLYGAVKRYTRSGKPTLDHINMKVRKGTIYSLLGASGCGKTTLLSCIVGTKRLDSGSILVYGAKPGTKESGVPGRRCGYMPQEIALYLEFSAREMAAYYGTLYGMPFSQINSRFETLFKLLDLPDPKRRIKNMSGGQQRRVSFLVALIHSPELLILDEPTVGVDPLLRKNIWNYVKEMVATQGTTVIITTHYTEEARDSHTVGLMRDGRMLVEQRPKILLRDYNTNFLEDVVVELCLRDNNANDPTDQPIPIPNSDDTSDSTSKSSRVVKGTSRQGDVENPEDEESIDSSVIVTSGFKTSQVVGAVAGVAAASFLPAVSVVSQKNVPTLAVTVLSSPDPDDPSAPAPVRTYNMKDGLNSVQRIKALTMKNLILMMRNLIYVFFLLAVPGIQIFILCTTIGQDPLDLPVGVVILENNLPYCINRNQDDYLPPRCPTTESIIFDKHDFSCRYLLQIPKKNIDLIQYKTETEAIEAAKKGDIWAILVFPEQFSKFMWDRLDQGFKSSPEVFEGSSILIRLDNSNKQICVTLNRIFHEAMMKLVAVFLVSCGRSPILSQQPLVMGDPIYGTNDTDFREYVAPGVLLGVIFFFPLCSSSIAYLHEKKQGTLDRGLVVGVQQWEIIVSFCVTESIILFSQTIIAFLILTVAYDIKIQGSYPLAIFLIIMVGLAGVSMGFFVSALLNEEVEAVLLAIGSFFPSVLMSGMLWPIQGMPKAMQYFTYLVPETLGNEAIRSIISRGWGIDHKRVWIGFLSTAGWIVLYWILTIYLVKFSRSRQ